MVDTATSRWFVAGCDRGGVCKPGLVAISHPDCPGTSIASCRRTFLATGVGAGRFFGGARLERRFVGSPGIYAGTEWARKTDVGTRTGADRPRHARRFRIRSHAIDSVGRTRIARGAAFG